MYNLIMGVVRKWPYSGIHNGHTPIALLWNPPQVSCIIEGLGGGVIVRGDQAEAVTFRLI